MSLILLEEIEALLEDIVMCDHTDNSKCQQCYAIPECLITTRFQDICGGPWNSKADRLKHVHKIIEKTP